MGSPSVVVVVAVDSPDGVLVVVCGAPSRSTSHSSLHAFSGDLSHSDGVVEGLNGVKDTSHAPPNSSGNHTRQADQFDWPLGGYRQRGPDVLP